MSVVAFSVANELCSNKQQIRKAIAKIGARNYHYSKDKAFLPSMASLPGNAWLTEAAFAKELIQLGEKPPFIHAIDKDAYPKPLSFGFSPKKFMAVWDFAEKEGGCFLERSVKSSTAILSNNTTPVEVTYHNFKSDFFNYHSEHDSATSHSLYYFDSCGGPMAGLNSAKLDKVADIDCLVSLIAEGARLNKNRTITFAATFQLNCRNQGGKLGLLRFLNTPIPPHGPAWFKNTQGQWAIKHEVVAQAISDYVNREVAKQTKTPLRLEFQTIYKNGVRSIMGTFCWTLNPAKEIPKNLLTITPQICHTLPVLSTPTESIPMKASAAKPSKPSKPRSMAFKKTIIKSLRSTITRICLENGVDDDNDIKVLSYHAIRDIKKMQIAGVKASIAKGHKVG